MVAQVRRDTPGFDAGFNVDDEILAIGDYRVLPGSWDERIGLVPPGSEVSVLVARRGALRRLTVQVGSRPADRWKLASVDAPSPAQTRQRDDWLSGR